MAVDEKAVNRTLESVDPALLPFDLDRRAFRRDLGWCGTWHAVASASRSHNRKRKCLAMLPKAAKRVRQLLNDERTWDEISLGLPPGEECPRTAIESLIKAAEAVLKEAPSTVSNPILFGNYSPFEYVAGHRLPRLFEKHFRQPARVQRRADGTPDGPYIRFAEAALVELGITNRGQAYRRESIAKALTNAQAGRIRRRLRRPGQSSS